MHPQQAVGLGLGDAAMGVVMSEAEVFVRAQRLIDPSPVPDREMSPGIEVGHRAESLLDLEGVDHGWRAPAVFVLGDQGAIGHKHDDDGEDGHNRHRDAESPLGHRIAPTITLPRWMATLLTALSVMMRPTVSPSVEPEAKTSRHSLEHRQDAARNPAEQAGDDPQERGEKGEASNTHRWRRGRIANRHAPSKVHHACSVPAPNVTNGRPLARWTRAESCRAHH